MAKSYPEVKGRSAAPTAPSKVTPIVTKAPTKVAVQTANPTPETKAVRPHKADRPTCAAVRAELGNTDLITKAKPYDGRQGTLRAAIVEAIQTSATVWDAVKKEVHGPGKYAEEAYIVKKVDVGFALANGYITTKPAPAAKK